jgi:hypothetical protein
MKAMGWKGQRRDDGSFMFSTQGQLDDEWYIVVIDNRGNNMFTYALGTVEEGDPHIGEQESLPMTEASVSELMNAIREGFGLSEQGMAEGWPSGVGRSSPRPETLSKRAAWQKTPLTSNKIVIDGYTINFTPDALIISRGGKVLWKKEGNYSQPTNSTLAGAKKLVTGLSRQGQSDEKQMFGKTDPVELQARRDHRKKWMQASNLASEKKISFQQAWKQLFGDDLDEDSSKAMADTAKRLANKDDGKVAKLRAAGDKRREDQLKGRNITKRDQSEKDEWGNYKGEGVEEARQSAQVKLAKAWDRQQAKSAASRERAKELLNPSKKDEKEKEVKATEEKQRLDPKCWKGYRKQGTKMKDGVRVNNCVKVGESWENELALAIIKLIERKL